MMSKRYYFAFAACLLFACGPKRYAELPAAAKPTSSAEPSLLQYVHADPVALLRVDNTKLIESTFWKTLADDSDSRFPDVYRALLRMKTVCGIDIRTTAFREMVVSVGSLSDIESFAFVNRLSATRDEFETCFEAAGGSFKRTGRITNFNIGSGSIAAYWIDEHVALSMMKEGMSEEDFSPMLAGGLKPGSEINRMRESLSPNAAAWALVYTPSGITPEIGFWGGHLELILTKGLDLTVSAKFSDVVRAKPAIQLVKKFGFRFLELSQLPASTFRNGGDGKGFIWFSLTLGKSESRELAETLSALDSDS